MLFAVEAANQQLSSKESHVGQAPHCQEKMTASQFRLKLFLQIIILV